MESMKWLLAVSWVLAGCFPHADCTSRLSIEWYPAICPAPNQDRIRFVIAGDPYEFGCYATPQVIDSSKWLGTEPVTVEVLSPAAEILAMGSTTVEIYGPYETGDFQCLDSHLDFYAPLADAALPDSITDAGQP
jgi:hypothetical protein